MCACAAALTVYWMVNSGIPVSTSQSIVGAIIGAAIMGVLRNGLVLLDVSAYWQQTVIGAVIILAVALDNLRHMKKKA